MVISAFKTFTSQKNSPIILGMNSSIEKNIFCLVCAIALITVAFVNSSCRFFTEVNQEEVNLLSSKTEMKSFAHLENPLVFTISVDKNLYLFGKETSDFPITETVGFIYAVYDTSSNSLFDWAFSEGRNYNLSTNYCMPTANGLYYSREFFDGKRDSQNYGINRLVRLNSSTGKIEKTIPKSSNYNYLHNTANLFNINIKEDFSYESDGNTLIKCDYTLSLRNTKTLEDSSISFTSDSEYASFTFLDNLYIIYTEGKTRYLKTISEDGKALITLLSFGDYEENSYDLINVSENYAFFTYYKYWWDKINNWDYKKLLIYDLTNPLQPALTITINNDSEIRNGYKYYYDGKFYSLNIGDNNLNIFQTNINNPDFKKVKSYEGFFRPIKQINSKIYLKTDNKEKEISYLDLENLEVKEAFSLSKKQFLEDLQ